MRRGLFQGMAGLFLALAAARGGLLPDMTNGAPGEFAARRAGAEVNASYRIAITNNGLYRINYGTLVAAGVSNTIGGQLRMFSRTQEVAVLVTTLGAMAADDYVLFYGQAYNGYYSNTNVYWLGMGGGGLRMTQRSVLPIGGGTEVTSRFYDVTYQQKALYRPLNYPTDPEIDHWWTAVISNTAEQGFALTTDKRVAGVTAQLAIYMRGLTTDTNVYPDHRTEVRLNGTLVGTFSYDGYDATTRVVTCSSTLLNDGISTVSLLQTASGVLDDVAFLGSIDLRYTRVLTPRSGVLAFAGRTGATNYAVTGFSTNTSYWVLDIGNPAQPVVLTNYSVVSVTVRFGETSAVQNTYFVCPTSSVVTVGSLADTMFRNLASTNRQADWIVICPYEFRRNTYRLLKHRYLSGARVVVAPVTDIYNEFSYGIKDAAAIKQFLGYAFHHWQSPPPKYALLIGKGSYDPRNRLNSAAHADIIPVHLGPAPYEWCSLDGWYATVNGPDKLADMALGRIAVTSDSSLSNVCTKINLFEQSAVTNSWRKNALLVADNADGTINFKGATVTNVYGYLQSNGFSRATAYLDDISDIQARRVISNQFNSGIFCASYFGHGAIGQWADSTKNLFNSSNSVPGLTNTVYPIVTALTCKNGDFDEPSRECLAEALLEKKGGGSSASIAADSLSIEGAAEQFANGFYEALVNTNQVHRLGDVMNAGLLKLWTVSPGSDELLFYTLFGDPGQIVNPSP